MTLSADVVIKKKYFEERFLEDGLLRNGSKFIAIANAAAVHNRFYGILLM